MCSEVQCSNLKDRTQETGFISKCYETKNSIVKNDNILRTFKPVPGIFYF